jgi:transketolase
MLGWDTAAYAARARAFGWRAIEIDGHDLEAIDRAYAEALEPRSCSSSGAITRGLGGGDRGKLTADDHEHWLGDLYIAALLPA